MTRKEKYAIAKRLFELTESGKIQWYNGTVAGVWVTNAGVVRVQMIESAPWSTSLYLTATGKFNSRRVLVFGWKLRNLVKQQTAQPEPEILPLLPQA